MKPKKTIYNKGFSLYEILITLLILSVLLSVAMPNLTRMISDQRKERTLDILNSAIYMGKNYAINNRKTVNLSVDATGTSTEWNSFALYTEDENILEITDLSGFYIKTKGAIKFNMNGQVFTSDNQPVTNQSFCIGNEAKGNTKYILSVNYLGKTSFEESDDCE
jgi:type IV fimbrial biogenesis protein FimT